VSLLDDHAQMIAAALTLHECGSGGDALDAAIFWAERVEDLFADRDHGGYFTTAQDAPGLILRPRTAHDSAQPSGNATMLENFARLFHLTGEARWHSRADALVAAFSADMAGNPVPVTGLLNACHTLCRGAALALPGATAGKDSESLSRAAWATSFPGLVRRPGDAAAADGVAVLCRGTVCGPPIRDPLELAEQLREARRQAS
ncbi:MAG: thioredoxin domain-containing protein, partial [Rhodothalassiaceae bacterium]